MLAAAPGIVPENAGMGILVESFTTEEVPMSSPVTLDQVVETLHARGLGLRNE